MRESAAGVDLDTSLGYLLKEAASALRSAMEGVLRPLDLNITQYACLELLAYRPGMSNSDLARGAFVTRQSMNVVLHGLERDGLIARRAETPVGRVVPTELTRRGKEHLALASAAVKNVEDSMCAGLGSDEPEQLRRLLHSMVDSLRQVDTLDA
jgi:DNA-binding MarR family transcriptional regulator